ncbi:MAG: hybrid sensor histidine kinase/response regulator, partial [Marinilabiliales bacterium]
DLKMPVLNGFDATKIIKEKSNLPIIAVSAFAFTNDKINATKAGCDEFISKPIASEELYDVLSKYLT